MAKSAQKRVTQQNLQQEFSLEHKTLVIGNIARWTAEGRALAPCQNVQFSELSSLADEAFRTLDPAIVLSPLLGDHFDVLDVAVRLDQLGFRGQYRAITETVPNRDMICREVKALAPDLDFDLLMLSPIANDL